MMYLNLYRFNDFEISPTPEDISIELEEEGDVLFIENVRMAEVYRAVTFITRYGVIDNIKQTIKTKYVNCVVVE